MAFLKFIFFALLLASTASSQQVAGATEEDDEKPFLRIVAPQYICNSKEKKSNASDSSTLTIGLQTREGQRLRFKIAIDFTMLDGFKSQRHTLSIWKNIRELQAKFHAKNVSDEISLRNQIDIDALELTPQVVYTFKIVGYDEKDRASEEQNFTITYKGDKLEAVQSNVGDGVSLLLYGPETFYTDLELLAIADVLFCDPVNDYYYVWRVKGMSKRDIEDYLNVKGGTLRLPSGVLAADTFYEVGVTIFNNRSQAMASVSLPVKVFAKDFQLQNVPVACSVGVGKTAPYLTSLYRGPIVNDANFQWTCSDACSSVFSGNLTDSAQVTASFSTEGEFELKTRATIKNTTKESMTTITVDSRIIPHAEMKFIPLLPLNTMRSTEIVVTLMDLVPKCVAQWTVMSGGGEFAKPKDETLESFGELSIKDYEEHFLQELVDYDNNTLSKDITLTIPSDALFPDVHYKFRLNIVCPEPLTDSSTSMMGEKRKNVTTFFDIVVATNEPPVAFPLEVSPTEGIAMKEKFVFKTGAAKDQQSDYPLKYTFGYHVDNLTIIIGTFYEYQVAQTQLPYSAGGIGTFLEISDNNNASIRVDGPRVKTRVSYKFTADEISFKLAEIRGMLRRAEYSKALNSAVTLILTQRKFATPENAKSFEEKIGEMLKSELESLQSSKSDSFVYQQNVIEFVKMSKNLISILSVYDEGFVESVLSLTYPPPPVSRAKRMTLSNGLRNRGIMTPDTEYIKNVLSLSDLLLSSTNTSVALRERRKFVEKIHQFVKTLCQIQNLNSHIIESKFVSFEVSKIYSKQLFDESQKFSKDTSSIIYTPNSAAFPGKFLCIGKIRYMLDLFDVSVKEESTTPVYETRILDDSGGNSEKELVPSKSIADYAIMEIPLKTDSSELSCSIWVEEKWSAQLCEKLKLNTTMRIACKCKTPKDSIVMKYDKSLSNGNEGKDHQAPTTESSVVKNKPRAEATLKFDDIITTAAYEETTEKQVGKSTTEERHFEATMAPTRFYSTEVSIESENSKATTKSTKQEITSAPPVNDDNDASRKPLIITTALPDTQSSLMSTTAGNSITDMGILPTAIEIHPSSTRRTPVENVSTVKAAKPQGEKANEPDATTYRPEGLSESIKMNKTSSKEKGAPKNETGKATDKPSSKTTVNTNTTDNGVLVANTGSFNWIVISLLCFFFLIILVLILLHRCRRLSESYVNLPMRHPAKDIKYAKYHDEFIMRG